MQETWVQSLGQEDPLEEEIATHSSIFAWKIPWTENPGGLKSMGSQKSWTQPSTHACKYVNTASSQVALEVKNPPAMQEIHVTGV